MNQKFKERYKLAVSSKLRKDKIRHLQLECLLTAEREIQNR